MARWIFIIILAYSGIVRGNEQDKIQKTFESHFVPIPVVYYTPETGIAAGATLLYSYRQAGQPSNGQRSSIFPAIIFTQNKQTILIARSRHNYEQDLWRQTAIVFYSLYPIKYYGIGDATRVDQEEFYDSTNNRFSFGLGRRIAEHLYLGVRAIYRHTNISKIKSDGLLDTVEPVGFRGGREQSLGYYLDFDSADDNFNPTRGVRANISYNQFRESYGSSFDYEEILLQASHYIHLTSSGQIAFAIHAQSKSGAVPFTSLSQLGGQRLMRGVFQGRFRDKNLAALQLEWREQVNPRWGWVVFASGGHVAPNFKRLTMNRILYSYGAGARYTVNAKANTVIRIDSGVTAEGYGGTYFGIGQAF